MLSARFLAYLKALDAAVDEVRTHEENSEEWRRAVLDEADARLRLGFNFKAQVNVQYSDQAKAFCRR